MYLPLRSVFIFSFLTLSLGVNARASSPAIEPPRVIEQPVWNYPLEAARELIYEGHTRVLVTISEEGQLLDFIVLGFTHPSFAQEVVSAMPRFRFLPARVRGEPSTTRLPITFHFEQQGNVVSMMASEQMERHVTRLIRRGFKPTVCPGTKLDGPLVVTNTVSPGYPAELRGRGLETEVTVDFYVDPEGRVRMPATPADAHPSFAREAIGAVEQWQFEPPTSSGEPVLVHVQQTFHFLSPTERTAKTPADARTAAASTTTALAEDSSTAPRF